MSFNRTPSLAHHADIDPGLESVLDGWRFPLRTDFARGIIWGPFRHTRGNSYHDGPDPALDRSRSYHEHSMAPARAQPAGRPRLLHQAAKALQARSKPTRPPQLFTLNIAPLGPHRRIRLCPSSQLKYGGHL
ncbi:hypothetical protein PtB15_9B386 [Puccinia triticina]|nr:hypothetical protein PtB15_9B386 [Puccinia triticina]